MFRRRIEAELDKLFDSGLPQELREPLAFLATGHSDSATSSVVVKAESRRAEIAAGGDQEVEIWYSPKPRGATAAREAERIRPEPGKVLKFTMAKVATTGKNQRWGTFLYLLARSFGSRTVLELGSCAGISAYYLSSVPSIETLITVEGSANLARISEQTLAEVSRKSRVVNKTFDEAIDSELPALGRPVDFVYVDGHHEKIATIHYFDRVVPFLEKGALVVFDDISWSQDMREAWEILRARREFSHTIDLGVIGVCLVKEGKDGQRPPATWDVRPIIGDRSIGDPKGWKE